MISKASPSPNGSCSPRGGDQPVLGSQVGNHSNHYLMVGEETVTQASKYLREMPSGNAAPHPYTHIRTYCPLLLELRSPGSPSGSVPWLSPLPDCSSCRL